MNNGQKTIATLAGALAAYALPAAAGAQVHRADRPTCQIILPDGATEGNYIVDPWPGGIVPYLFHANVSVENQLRAIAAMNEIENVSDVDFVPHTGEPNWIVFRDWSGNSACVGMPPTACFVNISDWNFRFIIVHEVMHVLGMWHEQQRPDRDQYVEINWDNIVPGTEGNYIIQGTAHGPYDFDSVMHYDRIGFGIDFNWTIAVLHPYKRDWQRTIGQLDHLSNGDIWVLNLLYGGNPPPGAFELASPPNGELVGESWTPVFSWGVSELADSYHLLVDDDRGFGTPAIDVTLSQTMYTHGATLDPNRYYYWAVTASNPDGTAEPYPFRIGSFFTGASVGPVLYVDDDAAAGGSGASWADAMPDLQDAMRLAEAISGTVAEIHVAQGVYAPDNDSADRHMSFNMVNGVQLRGGYAGINEPDPEVRDPAVYISVLSGDLFENDGPGFANNAENSTSVVYAVDVDQTAVLDGFQVSGGNADGLYPASAGGGITTDEASPIIRNCVLAGSSAQYGAGMEFLYEVGATVDGCVFTGNRTTHTDFSSFDGLGGALDMSHVSSATIINCVFTGNTAAEGGAVDHWVSSATYTNCLFSENTSTLGGAMRNYASAPVINTAQSTGGAISSDGSSIPIVANSVLWGNSPNKIAASATVSYSDVQGGFGGSGNIDADPMFVDGFHLGAGSLCIDAADNTAVPEGITTDLDGNPRFANDLATMETGNGECPIVDMGAYEFPSSCPWDLDCDSTVGIVDFLALLAAWGSDPGGPARLRRRRQRRHHRLPRAIGQLGSLRLTQHVSTSANATRRRWNRHASVARA